MNRRIPAVILALASMTLPAASGEAPHFLLRLLPKEILAGPQLGFVSSRFTASPDYRALIEPTPAPESNRITPSWGAVLSLRWNHGISLAISPRRETHSLESREETVSFPDNPFPHTLKASTELAYNVWPVMLGMGWSGARHHVQVRLGTYAAYLESASMEWIVDGEEYTRMPRFGYAKSYGGWMLGTEYGLGLGRGRLYAGFEVQRGSDSMLTGMEGSLKAQSGRAYLAYAWTLYGRQR